MTAEAILDLLAVKHGEDVFVSECKDGRSYGRSHARLDAWAMKRSWAHPVTWGYEIKVSRQDFLGDEKWTGYLEMCSDFSFVAPAGIIEPAELPPEVGLLTPSKNCRRLFTRKKAQRRTVEIPESLYRYILMSRTRIVSSNMWSPQECDEEFWRAWLRKRRDRESLGVAVRRALSEDARGHLREVEEANKDLRRGVKNYQEIKDFCERLGLDTERVPSKWAVEARLKEMRRLVPAHLRNNLNYAREALKSFDASLARIEAEAAADLPEMKGRTERTGA